MSRRILLLLGHPSTSSFNGALLRSYEKAARSAGAEVKVLNLGELTFDPILHQGYAGEQKLEGSLRDARKQIEWCEHLVVFCPMWWGTMPALLKGFIDRVFLPGWAFAYGKSKIPEKLLSGRSAQVIATMDSPSWWYRLAQRKSLHRTLGTATLKFCGFKTRFQIFHGVRESTSATRETWLQRVATLARKQA